MEEDGGERSSIVISLIENRAKEVGMAAFDLRSASLHLSQYIETSSSYQNTKTLLQFYDPMVVIVPPNKMAPDGMVGVSELVDRFYALVKKVVMARGCFDDTKGAVLIKSLAATEPSALGLDTYYKQYYLCLAAAAATMKWIEAEKGVIVTNHSLLGLGRVKGITDVGFFSFQPYKYSKSYFSHILGTLLGTCQECLEWTYDPLIFSSSLEY
ncbi:hypothetical protein RCOM_1388980 [Ricinus communis]|uniref:Uncharacterized protein n=1 Tax=Ricinus communis TaxID=3988 RepID=B9SXE0_RICCO|nr:hypothetical protein RCOM_1388980 [Ricinus communis]